MPQLSPSGCRTRFTGLVVLLVLTVAPSASAADKPYSLVISPGVVSGGTTITMTATFTNETAHQRLGAANLLPPAQFQVMSASMPPPDTATLSSSCTVGTLTGPCVQLRNLALPPGQSVAVTMSVKVPAATASCQAPTAYTWSVQAKQANNFNGSGNDLNLDLSKSSLTTAISCAVNTVTVCRQDESCSTSLSTSVSTFQVTANPLPNSDNAGTLSESVNVGTPLRCVGYTARDPNWFEFVSSSINRSKVITYRIEYTNPKGVQVCFGAPYKFETLGDQNAPRGTLPDGAPGYVGLLEHCESFPEPPEACVQSIVGAGRDTVVTIRIDAGLPGDPWGRM
jgi:hypothetical protein